MVQPTFPTGVKVQGAVKIVANDVGSLTAPSLATHYGSGQVDVSNMLFTWAPTATANRGNPRRRVGSTKVFETFGATTQGVSDLEYVVDPQADPGDPGKIAYEEFVEGTIKYVTERLGFDVDTDLGVGDFVIVRKILFGPQNIIGDSSDEFAEFTVQQPVALLAPGASELIALTA